MFIPWPEGSQENGKEEANDGILLRRLDRVSNITSDKKINCTVSVTKNKSSKGCQHFPIILLNFVKKSCQV